MCGVEIMFEKQINRWFWKSGFKAQLQYLLIAIHSISHVVLASMQKGIEFHL